MSLPGDLFSVIARLVLDQSPEQSEGAVKELDEAIYEINNEILRPSVEGLRMTEEASGNDKREA